MKPAVRHKHASPDASIDRGYAWHVYPDPATIGVMIGDNPFGTNEPPGPGRAPVQPPEGVVDFFLVGKNTPGIQNSHDGHSYLVTTRSLEPPKITPGWFVEAARLDESFQLDERGGRWIRIVQIVDSTESEWGKVQDIEFQVDRTK